MPQAVQSEDPADIPVPTQPVGAQPKHAPRLRLGANLLPPAPRQSPCHQQAVACDSADLRLDPDPTAARWHDRIYSVHPSAHPSLTP